MATASDTGNPPSPLAPRLRVGDRIPVFSLPNTSGVSVSSTVLLELGPLIITFYRGIWCPYCRSDLMALMNATFEVQTRGGSLAVIARKTAPNSNRRFQQQHGVDFPILNDATAAVARSFGIGWTEAYLQSLYDQFVADRTGDSPELKLDRAGAGALRRRAGRHDCLCRHQHRLSGGTRTGCGNGSAASPLDARAHGNRSSDTNGSD